MVLSRKKNESIVIARCVMQLGGKGLGINKLCRSFLKDSSRVARRVRVQGKVVEGVSVFLAKARAKSKGEHKMEEFIRKRIEMVKG